MKTKTILGLFLLFIWGVSSIFAQQSFTFDTTNSLRSSYSAKIDHPALNGAPNAIIAAEPVDPSYPHSITVWYRQGNWWIANIDQTTMDSGKQFRLLIWPAPDANHFVHRATPQNLTPQGATRIDHPSLNNRPNASWSVYQSISNERNDILTAYIPKGEYNYTEKKWYLVNESAANKISAGNSYNIVVFSSGAAGGAEALEKPSGLNSGNSQKISPSPSPAGTSPAELPEPLVFKQRLGKKITLYPGQTGDVGLSVAGNLLQIYSDHANADVAIGYDQSGTFNEKFRVKASGALAVSGDAGQPGQVLTSNGAGSPPVWKAPAAGGSSSSSAPQVAFKTYLPNESWEKHFENKQTATVNSLTQTVTIQKKSQVLVNGYLSVYGQGCIACEDPRGKIQISITGSGNAQSVEFGILAKPDSLVPYSINNYAFTLNPGTYTISFNVTHERGAPFKATGRYSSILIFPME